MSAFAAFLPPLLVLLLAAPPTGRRLIPLATVLAPVPALLLALGLVEAPPAVVDGFLLDARLGLDGIGGPFLLATSLLYLFAAVHALGYLRNDPRRLRFGCFFLVAMAGNLALPLALDAASFYLAYAVMGFSTWALVDHVGGAAGRHAGRVYLVWMLIGEVLVLAGLVAGSAVAGGAIELGAIAAAVRAHPWIAALLVLGFGVKAGLPGLHVWLPPAHSIAPAPASAVLSGAMLKVAVLGWLRLLPGAVDAAAVLVVVGLVGAFAGALLGLCQRAPKAILAYSSVSQMGFVSCAAGLALGTGAAGRATAAVALYVVHHALAKAGLFLGTTVALGTARRPLALGLLLFLALALAGAPLTGGALAKAAVKDGAPEAVALAFSVAALGSTALLARYLLVVRRAERHGGAPATCWLAFGACTLLAPLVPWLLAAPAVREKVLATGGLWTAAWPVLLGVALVAAALVLRVRAPLLPLGDLLVPMERIAALAAGWGGAALAASTAAWRRIARVAAGLRLPDPAPAERRLAAWQSLGSAFVLLAILLWWAFA